VTWQGQRVFVPSVGVPRLARTAADEYPVRRNAQRTRYVYALAFFPSLVVAFGIGDPDPARGFVVGVALSWVLLWLRDYRHIRHWPMLTGAPGFWPFMLDYLRLNDSGS
jgi:hypothetical protein